MWSPFRRSNDRPAPLQSLAPVKPQRGKHGRCEERQGDVNHQIFLHHGDVRLRDGFIFFRREIGMDLFDQGWIERQL